MTTIIGTGEVGALHSREELEEMQRLPLQRKIQITTARIIEWYQHYDGKVYVAFSGGKDSTVLLDIVRRIYPDVPAVFSDTGLEFPEVREFVILSVKRTPNCHGGGWKILVQRGNRIFRCIELVVATAGNLIHLHSCTS